MTTVLIVIHLMVVLAMIGLILLQRSEGGALGIGGGAGGFLTGRGAGNVLSHTTAWLAAVFFLTSVTLTILSRIESRPSDIFDSLPATPGAPEAPATQPEPAGAPLSAEDVLKGLGGGSDAGGPQTPPANGGASTTTPPAGGSAPATGSQPAAPSTGSQPAAPAVPAPGPAPAAPTP